MKHAAPLLSLLLFACAAPSRPGLDASAPDLPHLIRSADDRDAAFPEALDAEAEADGAALDAGAEAEALDAEAGGADAGGLDGATLDGAAPEGGTDAGPEPTPNACGGLGPLVCNREPCKVGATCATIYPCGLNVCADCPGADVQCSQCGGSWRWECAGANVLRCTNGSVQCQ